MNRPDKDFPVEYLYCDQPFQASSQSQAGDTKLLQTAKPFDILTGFSRHTERVPAPTRAPVFRNIVEVPAYPKPTTMRIIGKRPIHSEPSQRKKQRLALANEADDAQAERPPPYADR